MYVLKATGEKELFNENKLRLSIQRAGLPSILQNMVLAHIKTKLYDNIPTSQIYHHISEFLDQSSQPYNRTRYRLKHAIMEFGPTGYPFEDYVAEILKSEGYKTDVRQILNGKCVKHEIDIVAQKDVTKSMIECKFHNNIGIHTQIHVSLYTKARFDDLKDIHKLNDVWLVTNTRITNDALDYALCNKMKVISWNYPANEGLRDLIEKSKLHPITVLTTLSQNQKQQLLDNHIVLCKNVSQSLNLLNLTEDKKQSVLEEAKFVCAV